MSKFILDGKIKTRLVPSIASKSAPTIAEINAGVDLTPFQRSLDTGAEGSTVDAATADSTYNATVAGTWGGQPLTFEGTNDDVYADDDAYVAMVRGYEGYLVVCWRGGSGTNGAIAATDRVDVWPIEISTRRRLPYARNELARFNAMLAVPSPPAEDVVVAA